MKIFVAFLLIMVCSFNTFAAEQPQASITAGQYDPAEARMADVAILKQKLEDERAQLHYLQQQLASQTTQEQAWLAHPELAQLAPSLIDKARLQLSLEQIQLEKINIALTMAQENIAKLENNMSDLEKRLLSLTPGAQDETQTQFAQVTMRLTHEKEKLELEEERAITLSALQKVMQQLINADAQWLKTIRDLARKNAINQLMEKQLATETKIQQQQQQWEEKLASARLALVDLPLDQEKSTQKSIILQDEIVEAEENIQLLMIRFNLSRINTYSSVLMNYPPEDLGRDYMETHEKLDRLLTELTTLDTLIDEKQVLLKKHLDVINAAFSSGVLGKTYLEDQLGLFNHLMQAYSQEKENANQLRGSILHFQQQLVAGYFETWSNRQALPRTFFEWKTSAENLWTLPQLTFHTLQGLVGQVGERLGQAGFFIWLQIILFEAIWLFLGVQAYHYLKQFLNKAKIEKSRFSGSTTIILAQLFYRNIIGIVIFGSIMGLLLLLQLSQSSLIVPLALGIVWFVFKFMISMARLSLFENIWDISGQDVKLYRGLQWTLGIGGFVTAMAVLAHRLPVAHQVVAIYDRSSC